MFFLGLDLVDIFRRTNAKKQTARLLLHEFWYVPAGTDIHAQAKFSRNNHSFHLKQCFSGQEKVNEWPLKMNSECFCIYDFEYINYLSKFYRTDNAIYWSSSVTYRHILHHLFFKTSCCNWTKSYWHPYYLFRQQKYGIKALD